MVLKRIIARNDIVYKADMTCSGQIHRIPAAIVNSVVNEAIINECYITRLCLG